MKKLMFNVAAIASLVSMVAFAIPAGAAGPNPLLCFDGVSDATIYGGNCTITNGVATLDNNGGDPDGSYSGVYTAVSSLTGKTLSQVDQLSFNYTGTPTNGSPRFSIPLDTNSDGITDDYLFISAYWCNDGAGLVDPINDPTCQIFDYNSISGFANWAAVIAAYPTATIGPDGALPFIIADDAGLWTVSNVHLGGAVSPGNSTPGLNRYLANPGRIQAGLVGAQCGSGAGSGAFGYFGKGLNMAGGANGTQTGLNNSALCGNRQGNLP